MHPAGGGSIGAPPAVAAAEVVGNSLANFVLNDLRLDDPNLTTIPSQPAS